MYLKYRGAYVGTVVSYINMATREIHSYNYKYQKSIPLKLYASVLDLTGTKSHWYKDIYPIHTNYYYVAMIYSVLMIHCI